MQIKIEKLIFGGSGLGHLKDGRVVFIKKVVPGDIIEASVDAKKGDFATANLEKIIGPSKDRVEPKCRYFDLCGGCDYQNISYPNQLKFKEEIFHEVLKRAKINLKPEPIIAGSDQPFFYRNSIRFFFLLNDNNEISFARKNYQDINQLVEVESCLLQSETANQILSKLKKYINKNIKDKKPFWQLKIRQGKMTGEFMVEIITSFEELPGKEGIVDVLKNIPGVKSIYHTVASGKSLKNLHRHLIFGSPIIFEKIGSYKFQISPESFFQTNSLGIKTLYDLIKKYAGIKVGDKVFDLFCGTGTIGIYLSTLAKEVTGIEIVPEAIRDARDNAQINHIKNIKFVRSDLSSFNNETMSAFGRSAFGGKQCNNAILILDPPRAGLDKNLIARISKSNFKRLVYVSCNPATFARDIKIFESNGVKLQKVQSIDMFPQTHHTECVGLLVKD